MSLNWVMMKPSSNQFIKLPQEQILYTSPSARTSLSISTSSTYPAAKPFLIESAGGVVYITNQRVIYLPSTSTSTFQSFSSPFPNLHDTHVTAPWFGPNFFSAIIQPVPNGNFPTNNISTAIELKLTFKDGGAYDFMSMFEKVRERWLQAVERAQMSGGGGSGGGMINVDMVHADELPAYEAPQEGQGLRFGQTSGMAGQVSIQTQTETQTQAPLPPFGSIHQNTNSVPLSDELPPGYEESVGR